MDNKEEPQYPCSSTPTSQRNLLAVKQSVSTILTLASLRREEYRLFR